MLNFPVCMFCYIKKLHVSAIEPVVEEIDPCNPNPCGQYSNPPRQRGDRCDCSCLPGMIGSPPNCRPECIFNPDCPTDKACRAQKCIDPCPGLCGENAYCRVRNHVPICVCNERHVGDPFSRCYKPTSEFSKLNLLKILCYFSQQQQDGLKLFSLAIPVLVA